VEFEFDDDPARVDVDTVWAFLSTQAYWARWRSRSDVERQLAGAWRLVGGYRTETGELVGFARALSDGVSLAYLADLFVVDSARGRGIGKGLVRAMIDDGPGSVFRWMLHTADAHGLYEQFGFAKPDQTYLERPSSRPASG
jgi:GNAT superfamily N-acetyltransferase